MCGITGLIKFGEGIGYTPERLRAFASYNKYRGPDEQGELNLTGGGMSVFLSHYRLSILDLSVTGQQPMRSTDGKVHIIFNGEIFNFQAIRSDLEKTGVSFTGRSDTEVVLNAYIRYGIDKTLSMLEGMFALCITDTVHNICYLARDAFGKKPLYYLQRNGETCFSSDIRAFRELYSDLSIDMRSLSYYFSELSTPSGHSIIEGIKKVTPGTYLRMSAEKTEQHTFKKLQFKNNFKGSISEAIEETDRILTQSVQRRLVADVPVVTFLSGGIDSGLITAIAAMNYGQRISSYTVGYDNYPSDERPYAKLVAERYNTDHHEIILNPENTEIINQLIEEFGEPFGDSSMIPSYYVCSALSSIAKVALSGDGGDELFLGYPTYTQGYRMQNQFNSYRRFAPLVRAISKIVPSAKLAYMNGILHSDPAVIGSALGRSMGFDRASLLRLMKGAPDTGNAAEEEFRQVIINGRDCTDSLFNAVWQGTFDTRLLNDYLVKVDRSSMFASVEVRSPFLDDELQQFVCSMPYQMLMPDNKRKFLLRQVAQKYLPETTLNKKKTGFGIPVGNWFRTSWKKRFEELVLEQKQDLVDLDYDYIGRIFKEHTDGMNHDNRVWSLYVFHYWCQMYFAR